MLLRRFGPRGRRVPHNDDFPDQRVPYFIDADGVPCAVGALVLRRDLRPVGEKALREQAAAEASLYAGSPRRIDLSSWHA